CASIAQGSQHPHNIVAVSVDRISKVEAAAAALRTGDDEEVGEAAAMQPEEGLGPLGLPLLLQRAPADSSDSVEGRSAHPLEPGRVDQNIERIFNPLVDDAALVD